MPAELFLTFLAHLMPASGYRYVKMPDFDHMPAYIQVNRHSCIWCWKTR